MNQPDVSRPGSVLRAERENLGVSVREVAETLNLTIAMVEAIEADDLESLPGAVFARGYIRAYARLLELDPEPLLRQCPRAQSPLPDSDTPSEAPIWEWIRRRPALVLGGAGSVLVSLLVIVIALLWPGSGEEAVDLAGGNSLAGDRAVSGAGEQRGVEQPGAERWAAEQRLDDPAGQRGSTGLADYGPRQSAVPAPQTAESAGQPASLAAAGNAATQAVGNPGSAADLPVATPPDAEADADVQRLTAAGDDRLVFRFRDDCWLEVRRSDGESLYSDLSRAGSELELVGEGPFRILLGYAPGVRLTFNGEPVPLAPHTRNNVATLVLGQ